MGPELFWLAVAAAALAAVGVTTRTGLTAWREWLAFRRFQLGHARGEDVKLDRTDAGTRIELADLRERVRKLEAIAAGVDL